MLKVVQLQYSTFSGGSSAIRLQKAFINNGIDSNIVSLITDEYKLENILYLSLRQRLVAKLNCKIESALLKNGNKDFGLFSIPVFGNDVSTLKEIRDADIIYIHWFQNGFLNLTNIRKLAKLNKPIIMVLHDMWAITGGCHYSFFCDHYKVGCNNCQALANNKKNGLAAAFFEKKHKLYSRFDNIFFISPSKWLYNCAKDSLKEMNNRVFYIPNYIDIALFKPIDKKTAKYILNIKEGTTVISFGAISIDDKRKGWSYLKKALEILKAGNDLDDVLILIFGSNYDANLEKTLPFKAKFMGYLSDEYSISVVYNASDVFIVPSLADNQPTTVQESLCCGTPVVGFDVGGVSDMIRHKENGYLARYKDAEDISEGIKYCINNKVKGEVLSSFYPEAIIKKHKDLFAQVRSFNQQNQAR